jgi:DNA polymerase-3 subunit gamma/tau
MAPDTVRAHLATVLEAEGVPFDDAALRLLARAARGSMRDGLSLADQAIAYGGGRLEEATVRAMLGSVERSHAREIVAALAARDGPALLAQLAGLRERGQSAAGTLEEIALLLQQAAVEQAVPGALDAEDPQTEDARAVVSLLAADEMQLLYSMVLHGREELPLLGDEHAALTMVLLRFLAFPTEERSATAPAPRSAPLRAPAPPAARRSIDPPPLAAAAAAKPPLQAAMAPQVPATPPAVPRALGDRWCALVASLIERGSISALARELAWTSGLVAIDESTSVPTWRLQVESEALRQNGLRDRLAAALAAAANPVQIELIPGVPTDSPALRDAAERQRRQAEAEAVIQNDPVVRELLAQFKGARIVPGSIKPV